MGAAGATYFRGQIKILGENLINSTTSPFRLVEKIFLGRQMNAIERVLPPPPQATALFLMKEVFLNKIGQVATTQIFLKPTKFHGSMKKNLCQVPGPQLLPNSLHTPKNIDFII